MAITNNGNGTDYRGLSTDEKPTDDGVFVNALFLEVDTGDTTARHGRRSEHKGGIRNESL